MAIVHVYRNDKKQWSEECEGAASVGLSGAKAQLSYRQRVRPSVCLSACVCPSVRLSACMSVRLSVCLCILRVTRAYSETGVSKNGWKMQMYQEIVISWKR